MILYIGLYPHTRLDVANSQFFPLPLLFITQSSRKSILSHSPLRHIQKVPMEKKKLLCRRTVTTNFFGNPSRDRLTGVDSWGASR